MVDVVGLARASSPCTSASARPAHRRDRGQQPRELGVLRPVALDEQRAALRVEAERQEACRHLARPRPQRRRRRGCSSARGSRRCSRSPRTRTGASRSSGSRRGSCRGGRSRTAGSREKIRGVRGRRGGGRRRGGVGRSWGRSVRDRSHRPAAPGPVGTIPSVALPRHQLLPVSLQPLRVGVLGAGTVGREVVRALLERSPDGWPQPTARRWSSPAVAVRDVARARAAGIPEDLLTDGPAHLVGEPRRRRDRRGDGRRRAGADAGRGCPGQRASRLVAAHGHAIASTSVDSRPCAGCVGEELAGGACGRAPATSRTATPTRTSGDSVGPAGAGTREQRAHDLGPRCPRQHADAQGLDGSREELETRPHTAEW